MNVAADKHLQSFTRRSPILLLGILEDKDQRTSAHIRNLGSAIAPGCEPQFVLAKANTTYDDLVVELAVPIPSSGILGAL